jgi:RsiW-degrading membrane proteinase PrsW (M82 family)
MQFVGLLVYLGVVQLIVAVANPSLGGGALVIVGVVLALVPALLWMSLFYAQDRSEPEPRTFVLAVAALGALLAGAVGIPLLQVVFRVPDWIRHDTMTSILGYILVVGFINEYLKYLAIRLSVFYSREFDQRVDGVVYGSAAGLGYATMLNISFVVSSGGVDLGAGVVRIVITQLVHGSLGALLGYFLGRDKFDAKRVWWMSAGLGVAALLDGLFSWLSGEVGRSAIRLDAASQSAGYNQWPALALAAVLAAVLLAGIFTLIRRDVRADAADKSTMPVTGDVGPAPLTGAAGVVGEASR